MTRRETPWWLEPGPEVCPFCEVHYHVEAGIYCAACDRPVCPTCTYEVTVSRRLLCPECFAEADDE